MRRQSFVLAALAMVAVCSSTFAQTQIQVEFTPNSPTGFSPFSAVFHDGSFSEVFSPGDNLSGTGLELLAETGDNSVYLANASSSSNIGTNGSNLAPGESTTFTVTVDDANTEFNFASMVLFSNDWFVGNNGSIDITSLLNAENGTELELDITSVYDAGTETEDYTGVGGSGFFPFSTSGTLGVDISDGSVSVLDRSTNPYLDFTNTENLDLAGFDPTSLDAFTAASLGTVRLPVVPSVPEPSSIFALSIAGMGLVTRRRRSVTV